MTDFSPDKVFQMYVANGRKPGVWLRRMTWANTCAKVISVGELKGPPPYYGNPTVFADVDDLSSGELKRSAARIPAAGTYKTWRQIDPPDWAEQDAAGG